MLLYISTHTRPDIAFCACMLARPVDEPRMNHQTSAIKIVRYFNSAIDFGLVLKPQFSTQLTAQVDANWAGDSGTARRSRKWFCDILCIVDGVS